jgi:uncharacterized membrane protein YhhN
LASTSEEKQEEQLSLDEKRLIDALTSLAAITTAIDIEAVYFGPRTNVYIFKPLTTALIIAIALTVEGERRGYRRLIVAGLCFSLVGDVLLILQPVPSR